MTHVHICISRITVNKFQNAEQKTVNSDRKILHPRHCLVETHKEFHIYSEWSLIYHRFYGRVEEGLQHHGLLLIGAFVKRRSNSRPLRLSSPRRAFPLFPKLPEWYTRDCITADCITVLPAVCKLQ